jgi:hypothetical protein
MFSLYLLIVDNFHVLWKSNWGFYLLQSPSPLYLIRQGIEIIVTSSALPNQVKILVK